MTKKVIIAGSGSNSIGWEPIKKAVYSSLEGFSQEVRKIIAEDNKFFFMQLSTRLRTLQIHKVRLGARSVNPNLATKGVDESFAIRKDLIDKIAHEIRVASSTSDVRCPVHNYLRELFENSGSTFITLNWDLLLEKRFPDSKTIHVHGSIEDVSTFLLPTESLIVDGDFFEPKARSFLRAQHYKSIELIADAEVLVLWGCSLDHYDSEIHMIIREAIGESSTIQEIIVADPNSAPADRLKFLAGKFGMKVRRINPSNL